MFRISELRVTTLSPHYSTQFHCSTSKKHHYLKLTYKVKYVMRNTNIIVVRESVLRERELRTNLARPVITGHSCVCILPLSVCSHTSRKELARKPIRNYFTDKKLSVYGSLPRRPCHLEGREMPHEVLEDPDYPRASPNVSTRRVSWTRQMIVPFLFFSISIFSLFLHLIYFTVKKERIEKEINSLR